MAAGSSTTDITAIRKRAKQKMEEGPVAERAHTTYETFAAGDLVDLLGT
ncbi:MAG: hypothetical protein ABSA02_11870 [Trebonia sp.]